MNCSFDLVHCRSGSAIVARSGRNRAQKLTNPRKDRTSMASRYCQKYHCCSILTMVHVCSILQLRGLTWTSVKNNDVRPIIIVQISMFWLFLMMINRQIF